MKLLTYDPQKHKKVLCGEVVGDMLFRWVKPEHFMRVSQSYGIQEIAFQKIMMEGIKTIVLKEEATEQRWEASVETWHLNGRVADYGHGKQRFLGIKFMHTHKIPEPDKIMEQVRTKIIDDAQISLLK